MDERSWQEPLENNEPMQESPAVQNRKSRQEKKEKAGWQKTVLTYLHDLVFLLAALIVIFLLLFRVVVVDGTSMNRTLLDGDYLLLLSNTFYRNPQCGDVIVASKESFNDGAPIVKRVIAVGGQWVDIRDGLVYVGDSEDTLMPVDEPYTWAPTTPRDGIEYPVQVPEDCLFVMGDNRGNSLDSRHPTIGFIEKREVLGKVIFLFVPGTNKGEQTQDFERIGVVE